MMAAINMGLGTVVEALIDKGVSVQHLQSNNGYGVSELGEGDVSRTTVLTCVVLCCRVIW